MAHSRPRASTHSRGVARDAAIAYACTGRLWPRGRTTDRHSRHRRPRLPSRECTDSAYGRRPHQQQAILRSGSSGSSDSSSDGVPAVAARPPHHRLRRPPDRLLVPASCGLPARRPCAYRPCRRPSRRSSRRRPAVPTVRAALATSTLAAMSVCSSGVGAVAWRPRARRASDDATRERRAVSCVSGGRPAGGPELPTRGVRWTRDAPRRDGAGTGPRNSRPVGLCRSVVAEGVTGRGRSCRK